MLSGERREGERNPLTWGTFCAALAFHAALFLVLWIIGAALSRSPEVVIPIDMTIVPPWAEQTNDPEPDPLPPPKPEPEKPKPKPPEPKPEPPKLEETKQDAVVKEKPKPPKKKTERGEFLKDAKKVKAQPKKKDEPPPDFKKDAKLVKAPDMKKTGKATAADKPMTEAEYRKFLEQGYRIGARNQLAPNEESRCAGLVAAALKRHWVEEFHWTEGMQSVYLEITFGPGGSLRSYRIVRSSGDPQVDNSVLAAAKATGSVPGLSPDFVRKYSSVPFVIEMKPVRN